MTKWWENECVCVLGCFSRVWLFVILWTVDQWAPLSMGFSRKGHWSGLPCPLPGDLPDPGIEPESLMPPALIGGSFTTNAAWEGNKGYLRGRCLSAAVEGEEWGAEARMNRGDPDPLYPTAGMCWGSCASWKGEGRGRNREDAEPSWMSFSPRRGGHDLEDLNPTGRPPPTRPPTAGMPGRGAGGNAEHRHPVCWEWRQAMRETRLGKQGAGTVVSKPHWKNRFRAEVPLLVAPPASPSGHRNVLPLTDWQSPSSSWKRKEAPGDATSHRQGCSCAHLYLHKTPLIKRKGHQKTVAQKDIHFF